jgi:hypothetical protein
LEPEVKARIVKIDKERTHRKIMGKILNILLEEESKFKPG